MDSEQENSSLSGNFSHLDQIMKSSSNRDFNTKSAIPSFQSIDFGDDSNLVSNSIQYPSNFTNSLMSNTTSKRGRGRGRGRGSNRSIKGDRSDSQSQTSSRNGKQQKKTKKSQIFMQSDSGSEGKDESLSEEGLKYKQNLKKENQMQSESNSNANISEEDDQKGRESMYSQIQQQSHFSKQKNSIFLQSNFQDDDDAQDYDDDNEGARGSKQYYYDKLSSRSNRKPNNNNKIKIEDSRFNQNKSVHYEKEEGKEQEMGQEQRMRKIQQQKKQISEKGHRVRMYAENFAQYKKRRVMKYINGKIDCNTRYLHELVYDCYTQELICEQLMIAIKYMGLGSSLDFIQKYKQQKLSQFDFQKVKFTIFDHRRLVKLLKQKATKKQYTDQKQLYFMPYEMHQFLTQVYALPQDAYDALCASLDEAYQLNWWKTIGTPLKGKQPVPQVKPIEQNNTITKKRTQPKRIRYKLKTNDDKTEVKVNNNNKQKLKIQDNPDKRTLEVDNEIETQSKRIMPESSFNFSQIKIKTQKSSLLSSSLFETERVLDSQFSMNSDTHSLENVSDLLSDFNLSELQQKGKRNTRSSKKALQERQMQRLKKSSTGLKNLEDRIKNGPKQQEEKVNKETQKEKRQTIKQGQTKALQSRQKAKNTTQKSKPKLKFRQILSSSSSVSSEDSNQI